RGFPSADAGCPFPFVNLCHALDLDACSVRSRLVRWRRVAGAHVVTLPVQGGTAASPPGAPAQRRRIPHIGFSPPILIHFPIGLLAVGVLFRWISLTGRTAFAARRRRA